MGGRVGVGGGVSVFFMPLNLLMKHLGTLSQYCLETFGDSQPAACWLDQYQRQIWSKTDFAEPKESVV